MHVMITNPTKRNLEVSQRTAANQCTRKEVGEQGKLKSSDENIHSPYILYVKVRARKSNPESPIILREEHTPSLISDI